MSHSRRGRFPSRGVARAVAWSPGPSGITSSISASGASLFGGTAVADQDDETIVRTRGRLLVQLVSADALSAGFEWGFGMCVVSQNAAGIGVTAVPSALTDIGWDGWFVHETGDVRATSSMQQADDAWTQLVEIDSKAMRKLHDTDVIVASFDVLETPAAVMQVSLITRMLAKLP